MTYKCLLQFPRKIDFILWRIIQRTIMSDNNINPKMTNKIVVLDIQNDYPFGLNNQKYDSRTVIQTRKVIPVSIQTRPLLKQKIRMLKNLGFQHLVGFQSSAEQETCFYLLFEYVSASFATTITPSSRPSFDSLRTQLLQLANKMINYSIDHTFRFNNVGLDPHGNLKYYLGLDFKIDRNINKQEILRRYNGQIEMILSRCFEESITKRTEDNKKNHNFLLHENQSNNDILAKSQHQKTMKKSSIDIQHTNETTLTKKPEQRMTFDIDSPFRVSPKQAQNYNQQKTESIKIVKIQELGARINKLKNYMRDMTGKTNIGKASMAHRMVKIEGNNYDNRIMQENKIMITPNYTKLQKKIAQFRESRLMRAYKQREILYNQNNQGYQVHSTLNIQDNTRPLQQIKQKCIQPTPYNFDRKQKNSFSPFKQQSLSPIPDSKEQHTFGIQDERKNKQYKKLAQTDKYCEEFMFFLEDDQPGLNNSQSKSISAQNGKSTSNLAHSRQKTCSPDRSVKQRFAEHAATESSERGAMELQARVKNVIRHSIKLINNLKGREGQE